MCIAAAAIPAASLAISAVSTVASIGFSIMGAQQQAAQAQAQLNMQARQQEQQMHMQRQSMLMQQTQQRQQQILQQRQTQEAHNLQVEQANASIYNQYQQQMRQAANERATIHNRYQADKVTYQRSKEQMEEQTRNNAAAANRVYMAEQAKVSEAKKEAAFKQQEILAKSIGLQGTILASGRTGQSVGLLTMDAERQAGFQIAQESAMLDSKKEQAWLAMDSAWLQNQSANNQALGQVGWNPTDPYVPKDPEPPKFVGGIGTSFAVNK